MKRSGRVSERDTWMKDKTVGSKKLPGIQMREDQQPIRGCMYWPKEMQGKRIGPWDKGMQAHTRADKERKAIRSEIREEDE